MVAFDEFVEVMRKTELDQTMPFNMDSNFIKVYFGKDKKRLIGYAEKLVSFCMTSVKNMQQKFDKNGAGFISPLNFQGIMLSIKSHLLTEDVKDNLIAVITAIPSILKYT